MHTLTHKLKASKQTESAESAIPGRAHLGQDPEVESILHIDRTIRDQADGSFSDYTPDNYCKIQMYAERPNGINPALKADTGEEEYEQEPDNNHVEDYSITRLLRPGNPPLMLQAKLAMGSSGDSFEAEADRLSERIAGSAGGDAVPAADLLRQSGGVPVPIVRVAPQIEGMIHSRIGMGRPLPPAQREFFEPRLGRDLGDTRIHTDSVGATLAEGLGARALTVGRDIFFGAGETAAAQDTGSRLLAHELVHVAQQGHAPVHFVQRAETDTGGRLAGLADGAAALNTFVNRQIGNAVAAAVRPTGRSTLPRHPNPMAVVEGTFQRLGAAVPLFAHLTLVGDWAKYNIPTSGGGYIPRGHRYDGASGTYLRYLAPAVNLNGHCVGIDKIDHMFQQGYQYFLIWLRTVNQFSSVVGSSLASRLGDEFAQGWGEWVEGHLSAATRANPTVMTWLRSGMAGITGLPAHITGKSQGSFGLSATGVHSRGDLAANAAGLNFYRDLLRGSVGSFSIARYISADWDEEISGNIFRHDVGAAVTANSRLNPADVILPPPAPAAPATP